MGHPWTGTFEGAIAPSARFSKNGQYIACCCVVRRVNQTEGRSCTACEQKEHGHCSAPGYVTLGTP